MTKDQQNPEPEKKQLQKPPTTQKTLKVNSSHDHPLHDTAALSKDALFSRTKPKHIEAKKIKDKKNK